MREFVCALCGGTFKTETTETELAEEAQTFFPGADLDRDRGGSACDDCWHTRVLPLLEERN